MTISPSQKEVTTPDITYPATIFENEPITAKVENSEDFVSLIWMRNKIEFAEGSEFSMIFDDYQSSETIFLVYVTKDGAAGRTQFETTVNVVIEEPDEDLQEEPEELAPDIDEVDEDEIPDEEPDEINKKIKKSGCSLTLI